MAFGFGGSTSSAQSTGSSSSLDVSQSGSVSGGESVSGAQSSQTIAFQDIFAQLFGGASNAAAGLDPSMLSEAANQLFSGGLGFLENLSGGPGTDFLQSRVTGENPLLDENISALGDDISKFFEEKLLTGISSESVLGGSLGGARQGVAQGIAAEASGREFTRGATALRTADLAARDEAAATLGEQRIAGAQAGLAGLGTLSGLAQQSFGAELAPFQMLAQILGGTTVLGESSSFSNAADFAKAFSESFGASQSETQSTSGSTSVQLGF